jgi:hypothetical protein
VWFHRAGAKRWLLLAASAHSIGTVGVMRTHTTRSNVRKCHVAVTTCELDSCTKNVRSHRMHHWVLCLTIVLRFCNLLWCICHLHIQTFQDSNKSRSSCLHAGMISYDNDPDVKFFARIMQRRSLDLDISRLFPTHLGPLLSAVLFYSLNRTFFFSRRFNCQNSIDLRKSKV